MEPDGLLLLKMMNTSTHQQSRNGSIGDFNPARKGKCLKLKLAFASPSFSLRISLPQLIRLVAIDGAQIQTRGEIYFPIVEFMDSLKWIRDDDNEPWRGKYTNDLHSLGIIIHSRPGEGDVSASLTTGRTLRAECKKGPLIRSTSSREYPLIREALGQLVTIDEISPKDLLAVAVPKSDKFAELTSRWREAPFDS